VSGPVHDAVMLMAFGAPESERDLPAFLHDVTGGRPLPRARLRQVEAHYRAVGGGSPLLALTRSQAAALAACLERQGAPMPVEVGMRHWPPFIRDTLSRLVGGGARRVLALIMAPFESDASREAYQRAMEQACAGLGERAPAVDWAPALHQGRGFLQANVDNIAAVMQQLEAGQRENAALLFTAHSVPASGEDGARYARQFERSAREIALAVGHPRYAVAYQSRSGPPAEQWLEPELETVIRREAGRGSACLVIAPIGFVCEHVEVLYDLDIEARAATEAMGLGFYRAPALNDHPAFIGGLARLVLRGEDPA
jgi:ferrochelatase